MPAPDYAAEIVTLEKGLATGEARIESDGESVTYRSVPDITKALAYYRRRAAAASPPTRPATTVAVYDPR